MLLYLFYTVQCDSMFWHFPYTTFSDLVLILGSSQKPNIPLPSIVPKAETLELEHQVNVHELFSPSSPKETPVEQVTEQTNKTATNDQENNSTDMTELVEQEEGKIDFFNLCSIRLMDMLLNAIIDCIS